MTKLLDDLAEVMKRVNRTDCEEYALRYVQFFEDHAAEIERNARDDRQCLPAGWKIEVRYLGDRAGLCVMGPPEAGGFAIDGQTKDPSDIRDSVIRALGDAMRGGGE